MNDGKSQRRESAAAVAEKIIVLRVNGDEHRMLVDPNWTLAEVLRDKLGLTGTKLACNDGACGSCTVLCDGLPILSCMTLAIACEGLNILTIEGLSKDGRLDPLQESFAMPKHWLQCGICAPGMIMSAKALLLKNPHPSDAEIVGALSANICRCGNYIRAIKAVKYVAEEGASEDAISGLDPETKVASSRAIALP
ncbi:MAG: (2Fe-2S)-binding protein [Clostridiales Family XIII bacterium]|jgi:aerobic-type carbon monoxide dehydrogenase small subunit (CoxS/CutS family)|nr:(2Fe-2S)-binding protein [Clostridiales Family XIII bacterium]